MANQIIVRQIFNKKINVVLRNSDVNNNYTLIIVHYCL